MLNLTFRTTLSGLYCTELCTMYYVLCLCQCLGPPRVGAAEQIVPEGGGRYQRVPAARQLAVPHPGHLHRVTRPVCSVLLSLEFRNFNFKSFQSQFSYIVKAKNSGFPKVMMSKLRISSYLISLFYIPRNKLLRP